MPGNNPYRTPGDIEQRIGAVEQSPAFSIEKLRTLGFNRICEEFNTHSNAIFPSNSCMLTEISYNSNPEGIRDTTEFFATIIIDANNELFDFWSRALSHSTNTIQHVYVPYFGICELRSVEVNSNFQPIYGLGSIAPIYHTTTNRQITIKLKLIQVQGQNTMPARNRPGISTQTVTNTTTATTTTTDLNNNSYTPITIGSVYSWTPVASAYSNLDVVRRCCENCDYWTQLCENSGKCSMMFLPTEKNGEIIPVNIITKKIFGCHGWTEKFNK